jgi:hypothetical protein
MPHRIENRRLQRAIGRYLPDGWPSEGSSVFGLRVSERRSVDFMLVRVSEDPLADVADSIGAVVSICIEHGAVVETIVSTLVVATYGALEASGPDARTNLVHALLVANPRVAVIHGKRDCLVGCFGSEKRMHWFSLIPDFFNLLSDLAALRPGQERELA